MATEYDVLVGIAGFLVRVRVLASLRQASLLTIAAVSNSLQRQPLFQNSSNTPYVSINAHCPVVQAAMMTPAVGANAGHKATPVANSLGRVSFIAVHASGG
jgi:hypothetical protein